MELQLGVFYEVHVVSRGSSGVGFWIPRAKLTNVDFTKYDTNGLFYFTIGDDEMVVEIPQSWIQNVVDLTVVEPPPAEDPEPTEPEPTEPTAPIEPTEPSEAPADM